METFELAQLISDHTQSGKSYLEFLRVPSMSIGLYELPAGGTDPQQPHTEDEAYYVVSGKAIINVDGQDRPVQSGSIIYVAANVEHRFHTIKEDITILVFFAPAEYTNAKT